MIQNQKDILPLQHLVKEVGQSLGIEHSNTETMTTIWEDNEACLKLANTELPYMTNCSKHIAIKYHWFREKLGERCISVRHVITDLQKADIFTKGLTRAEFIKKRVLLMG